MLTPEQKERLEALRINENLNEEEKKELAELEALEPDDPNQDAFDSAWDKDDWDGDDSEDTDDTDDNQEGEETEDRSEEDDTDDVSIFNQTPDEDSDQDQDSDDEDGTSQEETPEQKIARLEAENATMSQRMSSWEGRLKAEAKRANEAEERLKKQGQGRVSDVGASPDGGEAEAKLSAFIEEFPDLKEPIEILIDKRAEALLDKRLGPVEESVTEVRDTLKMTADERHFAEISEAHPDWERIVNSGALQTWIGHQPNFLQPRLNEIAQRGNSREVIEMFDQYKKATGKAQLKTNTSKTTSKKKKAQSIEAVPASTGGPRHKPNVPDKDDFDGAWKHWTKSEKS